MTVSFLSSFCWGRTADREDLRVACFFLVRLDSIEIFFLPCVVHFLPHLTSHVWIPFLTSLVALALTGIISAKQSSQAVRAPPVQSGCPPLRHS